MTTIYLSSTFRDMEPYRAAVVEAILTDAYNEEIRLLHAETAVNKPTTVWEEVESEVMRCKYYFILLGERYGDIYDNKGVNPQRISYTEHEFNTAVKGGKKIVAFWGEGEHLQQFIDLTSNKRPDKEKQEKLKSFKKRVEALSLIKEKEPFSNKEGLVNQVQRTVHIITKSNRSLSIDNYIHVYCDRKDQVTIFNQKRLRSGLFNTFVVRGDSNDFGLDLITRFCFRDLSIKRQPPTVELGILADNNDDNVTALLNEFLKLVNRRFFKAGQQKDMLIAFDLEKGQQILPLCLNVSEKVLIEDQKVNFLKYFIDQCTNHLPKSGKTEFYLFINIQEEKVIREKSLLSFFQRPSLPSQEKKSSPTILNLIDKLSPNANDTKRLGRVSQQEIVLWMMKELGISEAKAYSAFDEELKDLKDGYHDMTLVYKNIKEHVLKPNQ
ncbi:DUF4062 domain-containing protein [Mucilaginibacter kameinonensis]|uniref:DUF4062 domain-containing protein n=1 Tax=Mucilaginibacter kameinonensis TaxID=452286 RepID=UPI000EF7CD8B|nr:DUF4062 domain-containing protein [Mucilaginibacter kameinonensis]